MKDALRRVTWPCYVTSNFNINFINISINKRKRIEETLFNIFASEKNNYLNINIIFLKNYNNEFNIISLINRVILIALNLNLKESLIIKSFNLKCSLLIEKTKTNLNLNIKIYINSSYLRYFFVNRLLFIIYKEI